MTTLDTAVLDEREGDVVEYEQLALAAHIPEAEFVALLERGDDDEPEHGASGGAHEMVDSAARAARCEAGWV